MSDGLGGGAGLDKIVSMRKKRIKLIRNLERSRNSCIFVLWNKFDQLKLSDFFTLADMLEDENPTKDIELILLSLGGSGEAGYRIGHAFQQWSKRKGVSFRVIIPLYAKSAATILSLGADELVMGLQSEMGPIDPQFRKLDRHGRWRYIPAMAVFDGLKLISEYIDKIPAMSRFFEETSRNERLALDDLGILERARESGKQYGETLLGEGMMHQDKEAARKSVERLSDHYKYHGHLIDMFEAKNLLQLTVNYCEGEPWNLIKSVRNEYERFVGQPGLLPGAIITSAIETANLRKWRYVSTEEREQRSAYTLQDPQDILP